MDGVTVVAMVKLMGSGGTDGGAHGRADGADRDQRQGGSACIESLPEPTGRQPEHLLGRKNCQVCERDEIQPMGTYLIRAILGRVVLFVAALSAKYVRNNLVILERRLKVTVSADGSRICGLRSMRAYTRWRQDRSFPLGAVSAGPTGRLTKVELRKPKDGRIEIIEGGLGQSRCAFRVQAPGARPTYLFRKPEVVEEKVYYEAEDVYTRPSPNEPMTWGLRLPHGVNIPRTIVYELELPEDRPCLSEPRVYRNPDLGLAQAVHSDQTLDKAEGWVRLPPDAIDSHLEVDGARTRIRWELKPYRANVSYMIEWDWWD